MAEQRADKDQKAALEALREQGRVCVSHLQTMAPPSQRIAERARSDDPAWRRMAAVRYNRACTDRAGDASDDGDGYFAAVRASADLKLVCDTRWVLGEAVDTLRTRLNRLDTLPAPYDDFEICIRRSVTGTDRSPDELEVGIQQALALGSIAAAWSPTQGEVNHPAGFGGQPEMASQRGDGGMMRWLFGVLLAVILGGIMFFLLRPLLVGPDDTWEKKIDFAVAQASKACLLNFSSVDKREIEADLATRLKNVGGKGASTIETTRKSVSDALSEAGQLSQDLSLRSCVTERTNFFLNFNPRAVPPAAALPMTAPPAAAVPPPASLMVGASGPAVGTIYYEEDKGRLTADGVFGPADGSPPPSYLQLAKGDVLQSVAGAHLRTGNDGSTMIEANLPAGQCVEILEPPSAPRRKLTAATSGGRLKVSAVSCPG